MPWLAGYKDDAPAATTQPTTMAAATQPANPLDQVLEPLRAKYKLPALAGAIVHLDGSSEVGAVGLRRLRGSERITVNDQWHLGSNTKAMTATLVAQLVEEGKLRWDMTLGEVFPELAEKMHPDFRAVTLEQLLAHRAGLPHDAPDALWERVRKQPGTPMEQRRALVAEMFRSAPVTQPGTAFAYSNVGYWTAGAMIERVTGQAWETLIQERLFKPLGITSGGFGPPGDAALVDQPWGHAAGWLSVRPMPPGPGADNPPMLGPAGTVHMTLQDYAKFVALHLRGARGDTPLLKQESFRKLHTPVGTDPMALGWMVTERPWGGTVLNHAGSNTLWYLVVWAAPEKGFAVVTATNQGGMVAQKATDEAAWALIQRVLRKSSKP